jgi:hypothetical protein
VSIGKIGRLEATYKANHRFTPNRGLVEVSVRLPQEQAREMAGYFLAQFSGEWRNPQNPWSWTSFSRKD